ncbi:MAG: hypothetical protein ACP5QO_08275, partial [Clostridia bacterium]
MRLPGSQSAWPFRRDLYRSTASFYDAHRVPYPSSLAVDLVHPTRADGQRLFWTLRRAPVRGASSSPR